MQNILMKVKKKMKAQSEKIKKNEGAGRKDERRY
jgi:hypothetical protein